MKEIIIGCKADGKITSNNDNLILSNENESVKVKITFGGAVPTYTKRCDIFVGNDQTLDYETGTISDTLEFYLTNAHLKQGVVRLQPLAYLDGDEEYINKLKYKWETYSFVVAYSVNASESTVEVDTPIAVTLQAEIDALELSKVDKVSGKSLVLDTQIASTTLPRWTDLTFPFTQAKLGSNLKPDFDYDEVGLLFPQNNVNEIIYIVVQFPHGYKEGSAINPHIHCVQKANQAVSFTMEYKWYNVGDLEPSSWSTHVLNTYTHTYVSGSLSQVIEGSAMIDGTGKEISSILKIKLFRTDNTYTGDFLASQFDIHYQIDAFGSTLEYTK